MAPKKKEEHVIMRNGQAFCSHCGESCHVELPAPVEVVTGAWNGFIKAHKNCPKTWTEPVVEQSKSEVEKALFWLANGERGISSETMFKVLSLGIVGIPQIEAGRFGIFGMRPPSDPDDFRRCHLLLETVPEWRETLWKLKPVSPVWEKLVDNWDKLTEMLKEQMATDKRNGMYEFMKELGC